MINLKNIVVTFHQKDHEVTAVNDVSLEIAQGDIYGIVGYSGAGKSTLVRNINLLQMPTSGKVSVDGKDLSNLTVRELREERKKIGMIFQHFNLFDSRTIADNVGFALSNLTKAEKAKKVEELLDLVGILDKKDAFPEQLSGGQKQRVAIARALANDPKILLCDEATSALDPKTTLDVLALLKDLQQKLGLTIVIITHEMQVVKEICNQVAVMEKGRIIERGRVIDIFNNPQEPLTVDFIRTATHLDGAEEIVLANNPGDIYELIFSGSKASDPVIIELYKQYDLTASILYGNVEYIQNEPLGILLVKFDKSLGDDVKSYLDSQSVRLRKLERSAS
ncbi:MAG: ATP-binding cassette domain-containing protein [Streptococcaceae bacterium]|nr:ATP-binding cassette domain-containing protein [Streptococcaceae bacterium]